MITGVAIGRRRQGRGSRRRLLEAFDATTQRRRGVDRIAAGRYADLRVADRAASNADDDQRGPGTNAT